MNSAPSGQVDVLGSPNGDRLDSLVAHDRAAAKPTGAGPGLFDGSRETPIFTGHADGGHLRVGLLQLLADQVLRFQGAFAHQMRGVADFHLVVVYPDIDPLGGFVVEQHLVITGVLQFRRPEAAHHGIGQQFRLRRNKGNHGAIGAVSRRTVKKAGTENQQIFAIERSRFRGNPVPVQLDAGPETAHDGFPSFWGRFQPVRCSRSLNRFPDYIPSLRISCFTSYTRLAIWLFALPLKIEKRDPPLPKPGGFAAGRLLLHACLTIFYSGGLQAGGMSTKLQRTDA